MEYYVVFKKQKKRKEAGCGGHTYNSRTQEDEAEGISSSKSV
jgi:hypothetical protein